MIAEQFSEKMDSETCHQCGIQYSRNHLYKVEDKLKKNVLISKEAFVNEQAHNASKSRYANNTI